MGFLLEILSYSIGYVFWGAFLTFLGVFLMFFLIKAWRKNYQFTLISFIVGVILFFFLSFQSILLCGALSIKSYSDEFESTINSLVSQLPSTTQFTQDDSQQVLDYLTSDRPLVGYFVNWADFSGHTPQTLATAMVDELNSTMNYYILRRVLWSLFFVVTSVILILKTMDSIDSHRRQRGNFSDRETQYAMKSGGGARRGRFHD